MPINTFDFQVQFITTLERTTARPTAFSRAFADTGTASFDQLSTTRESPECGCSEVQGHHRVATPVDRLSTQ